MTIKQAKSELMQIYGALSPDKQRAIDTLVKIEPCEDAISRQAVDNYIIKLLSGYLYDEERTRLEELSAYLWELPSVNPQEPKYCDRNICIKNEYNGIGCDECEVTKSQDPKTGHWISYWDEEARCYVYKCPECGNKQPFDTKHCWECGARLDAPDINVGRMSEIPTGSESEDKE